MPDTISSKLLLIYIIYLVILSVITFILYGTDKRKSKKGEWRICEKTLLWLGLLGGASGGILGMKIFHHKTRYRRFWVVNIIGIIIHSALLAVLYITSLLTAIK